MSRATAESCRNRRDRAQARRSGRHTNELLRPWDTRAWTHDRCLAQAAWTELLAVLKGELGEADPRQFVQLCAQIRHDISGKIAVFSQIRSQVGCAIAGFML
jgi:hypothetical protein